MFKDSKMRTILKTISWRFTATLTTMMIVYIFTGQIETAIEVGLLEMVAKLLFYYFHERAWDKLRFGKVEVPPLVLWITGIPRSGKTTLGDMIYKELQKNKLKMQRLDSHDVRPLFPETGFTRDEVNNHIKRVGHLASMMEKNGIITIASFVSPFAESRDFVRKNCKNYVEVYLKTTADEVRVGHHYELYDKAEKGLIKDVAGMDVKYETSPDTEIVIETGNKSLEQAKDDIVRFIRKNHLKDL